MKKKQFIKALVFSAVLAAFPAATLSASAEDAAPEALDVAPAPVAVAEAAPAVVEAPVAAEVVAQPVVVAAEPEEAKTDDAAPAAEEAKTDDAATQDPTPAATLHEDVAKQAEEDAAAATGAEEVKEPVVTIVVDDEEDDAYPIDVPSITTAKIDKEVLKAGTKGKVEATVDAGFTILNEDGDYIDYLTGTRFFSSDNSIATVDPDGTIHALKEGKVTIWVETYEGLSPVTLDISESYNVLLIDKSESVKGKGLAKEKAAAISYADEVLKVNKESHVAIIEMGSETTTKTLSGWTSNMTDIKNIINGIKAEGGSVYSAAIKQAGALLNTIPYYKQGYNKNIVMFADGCDTNGDRDYAADCLFDIEYYAVPNYTEVPSTELLVDSETGESAVALKFVDAKGNLYYGVLDDDAEDMTFVDAATGLKITEDIEVTPLTDLVEDGVDYVRDRTVNFYAFGVYDSATKEAKEDGSAFLKTLAGDLETDGDVVAFDDNYFEVTSVKDMQQNFKNIANKKVYSSDADVANLIGFDIYVYGKAGKSDDSKAAKAKDKKTDSPATADATSVYAIALFALVAAGAAAFTAKKRED